LRGGGRRWKNEQLRNSLYTSGYTISLATLRYAKSPIWLQENTCPDRELAGL
jgi:hypothetical protein